MVTFSYLRPKTTSTFLDKKHSLPLFLTSLSISLSLFLSFSPFLPLSLSLSSHIAADEMIAECQLLYNLPHGFMSMFHIYTQQAWITGFIIDQKSSLCLFTDTLPKMK